MDRIERWAVLVDLAETMREHGSWSGETHLQKSSYLAQELTGVPFDYDFVLYKHGPYSFDLRDELAQMRARNVIDREPQPAPYGPKLSATESGKNTTENHKALVDAVHERLDFIAERLNGMGAAALERISTAFHVSEEEDMEGADQETRAGRLHELKPHISLEQARSAVEFVDEMSRVARERFEPLEEL